MTAAYRIAVQSLLDERNERGHWSGELSTSALSTATAVVALEMMRRNGGIPDGMESEPDYDTLIRRGLLWLAEYRNPDGGWGDTTKSISNISTTMLCHSAFHAAGGEREFRSVMADAASWIEAGGGVGAVLKRYGKDRTFSVPILTHCAIAGQANWKDVIPLPFELACLPARFYRMIRLPVVSYALPALIAIGERHFHEKRPWNPVTRTLRHLARNPALRVLERIQPHNGGFLEATPLTAFATMSLASMGHHDHTVARRGIRFIIDSVRSDGGWPIDTNLATWVTTLAVNGLRDQVPDAGRGPIRDWLLGQQYRHIHPYTNADPGGWAWTDLPGGVPDADDTPGVILALMNLQTNSPQPHGVDSALAQAVTWLLDLQNRDSGWPTFCRGWGALPFDRSAPDITAHVLRALLAWTDARTTSTRLIDRTQTAIERAFGYLDRTQRDDGSWLPLWFGNQFNTNDENPTYGTGRVLLAYRDAGRMCDDSAQRGVEWLRDNQNSDKGWAGARGIESTVEETSIALEALLAADPAAPAVIRGLEWLVKRVETATHRETSPIGFYFAGLWYFESLYPLVFIVSALGRAVRVLHTAGLNDALSNSANQPATPDALIKHTHMA